MGERPRSFVPESFVPDPPAAVRRGPVSAEDFMTPEQIANRDMTGWDLVKGAGKGLVRSALGIADLAAQTRMFPGMTPENSKEILQSLTPEYTNDAQRLGGTLETAAEVAVPAVRLAGATANLARQGIARYGPELLRAGTSETSLLTQARQAAARKVLGRVIDLAAEKPQAVRGTLRGAARTIDDELASALEELRQPAASTRVELPPVAELPPGYTPRTSAPAPKPAPKPAAEPKSAAARPTRVRREPTAAEQPDQRAYFLKPSAETPVAPRREAAPIGLEDLPTSWRSRTTQDLPGLQGVETDVLMDAFAQEIADRGLSVSDAIAAVSKNTDLPIADRNRLLTALMRMKPKGK